MYIGEISKLTGLSIKAIRLYEERGLIMAPLRKGNYRFYNDSHVDLLNLIKEAKTLGSTLSQLKDVIVYRDGQVDWLKIADFLENMKQQMIKERQSITDKITKIDACITTIHA